MAITPELFSLAYLHDGISSSATQQLSCEDIMATLAKFTAVGIINAMENIDGLGGFQIYISGGGIYNPEVIGYLEAHFKQKLYSTAQLGNHPDAKEAVLFAVLANEALPDGKTTFRGTNVPFISMGKISFPY